MLDAATLVSSKQYHPSIGHNNGAGRDEPAFLHPQRDVSPFRPYLLHVWVTQAVNPLRLENPLQSRLSSSNLVSNPVPKTLASLKPGRPSRRDGRVAMLDTPQQVPFLV